MTIVKMMKSIDMHGNDAGHAIESGAQKECGISGGNGRSWKWA